MPEMMPNATTESSQSPVVPRTLSTCTGSRSWMGVSCAIQMPSQAAAKAAIQPPVMAFFGSANGESGAAG